VYDRELKPLALWHKVHRSYKEGIAKLCVVFRALAANCARNRSVIRTRIRTRVDGPLLLILRDRGRSGAQSKSKKLMSSSGAAAAAATASATYLMTL
jgi:hypothetical protein